MTLMQVAELAEAVGTLGLRLMPVPATGACQVLALAQALFFQAYGCCPSSPSDWTALEGPLRQWASQGASAIFEYCKVSGLEAYRDAVQGQGVSEDVRDEYMDVIYCHNQDFRSAGTLPSQKPATTVYLYCQHFC